jgi:hypothetical protein
MVEGTVAPGTLLVVSIDTPSVDVDIYSPVANQIAAMGAVPTGG